MNSDFIVLRDLYTRTQALQQRREHEAEIGVADTGEVVDSTQQPESGLGYYLSYVVSQSPVTEATKANVSAVFNRCSDQVEQFNVRDRFVSLRGALPRQLAGNTSGAMADQLKALLDSEWGKTHQLLSDIETFVKTSMNGLDSFNRVPKDIDDPGVDEGLRSTFKIMEYNQKKLVERIEDMVNRSANPEAIRAELKKLYERLKDEKVGAGQEEGDELAQSNLKLRLINRMMNVLPDLAVAPIPLPEVRVIERDADSCLEGIAQYINGVTDNASMRGLRGAYLAKVSRDAAANIKRLIERSHTSSGQKVFIMNVIKADHLQKLKKVNDRISGGLTPLIARLELLDAEYRAKNEELEACPPVAVVPRGGAVDIGQLVKGQADIIVQHLRAGGAGHEQGWCEVLAQAVAGYPLEERSKIRFEVASQIEQQVSAQLSDPAKAKGVFNVLYHGAGMQETQSVRLSGLSDQFKNLALNGFRGVIQTTLPEDRLELLSRAS
ncbi:hypothetical protein [Endozoicomonas arenosclerae]|uniref:hypothetical protein n=1 Tax=Endozoicomonas arenosclerae TaxID=1633495 RepID=UPI0007812E90|nr:hypothetical protein [Endozoicomonas arenosclerae]